MSTQAVVPQNMAITTREEFSAHSVQLQKETAIAAVQAREQAIVQAEYLMAERHPRNWEMVSQNMLAHCDRPRFAEVSRYAKPVGKKLVAGEWVEQFATGFTARFAETLAQEMGNVKPMSAVTFEDDLIRIVRFTVVDMQKNLVRHREVTFAKTVEKRGRQDKKTKEWAAPEGRDVISQRINSYGDPTYLVRATDDEMRNKVNSEESKTQRDFILKFCPRDILEECEDKVAEALAREDQTDPAAGRKRLLAGFRRIGVDAEELATYTGKATSDKWTAADVQELRQLGVAIKDGETTFQQALAAKYSAPVSEDGQIIDGREAIVTAAEEKVNKSKERTLRQEKGFQSQAKEETEKQNLLSQIAAQSMQDDDRFARILALEGREAQELPSLNVEQLRTILKALEAK